MSRRVWGGPWWHLALVTAWWTAPVAGQTAAAARARLAALSESLDVVVRLERARDRAARPEPDSIRVAATWVMVPAPDSRALLAARPYVERLLHQRYGPLGDSVKGKVWVSADTSVTGRRELHYAFSPVSDGWSTPMILSAVGAPAEVTASAIAEAMALDLWARTGSDFRAWVGGAPPYPTVPRRELEAIYLELVTHPSRAVHGCFLGDPAACRRALGLVATARPAIDWYDADDRRGLVESLSRGWSFSDRTGQVQACVDRRDDGMCDYLVSLLPPEMVTPLLSPVARRALATIAVRYGGGTGFVGLVRSKGSPLGERLTQAAGIPLDSLVIEWREAVLDARPATVAIPPRSGWVAFAWGVVLGLVALRSTRWR